MRSIRYLPLILTVIFLIACKSNGTPPPPQSNPGPAADIKTENPTKTEQKTKSLVTFIELGSINCIPCKQMQPVMKAIEEKYPEKVKVVFYDVWTQAGRPYAQQYGIRVIPTQVFLDENGKEFFRHEGFFPLAEIEKLLKDKGV
ncbi:MAG: thioredoxin family protein [Fidelibacterota bacterium]